MIATTPLFAWKDSYTVQVREMDLQHKRLVNTLNQLHEAMAGGQSNAAMLRILCDLIQYTQQHFAAEEQLMQKHGYARLASHKLEHHELTQRVLHFQEEFRAGKISLGPQVLQFLKHWLVDHIQGSDQLYGKFLRNTRPHSL